MNRRDSSGFDQQFERPDRFWLNVFPRRDLREWAVRLDSRIVGFVYQEGNSRFKALSTDTTFIGAYANLERALQAAEMAEFIRVACSIRSGLLQ
jgi:hypothetical protein